MEEGLKKTDIVNEETIEKIPKTDLEKLIRLASKEAAKTCIAEMEKQRKLEAKRNEDLRYKKTKGMLKSYRMIKAQIEDENRFTNEEKAELRWKFLEDLMGDSC